MGSDDAREGLVLIHAALKEIQQELADIRLVLVEMQKDNERRDERFGAQLSQQGSRLRELEQRIQPLVNN